MMNETNIDIISKELSELLPTFSKKLVKPMEQQTKIFLSPMQMHALFELSKKQVSTMTELSNEMNISKQQMTPIVDKLVKYKYVIREHDEVDRRTVNIRITSAGINFLNNFNGEITRLIKEKIQCLDKDDLATLHNSLTELYKVINKIP